MRLVLSHFFLWILASAIDTGRRGDTSELGMDRDPVRPRRCIPYAIVIGHGVILAD